MPPFRWANMSQNVNALTQNVCVNSRPHLHSTTNLKHIEHATQEKKFIIDELHRPYFPHYSLADPLNSLADKHNGRCVHDHASARIHRVSASRPAFFSADDRSIRAGRRLIRGTVARAPNTKGTVVRYEQHPPLALIVLT